MTLALGIFVVIVLAFAVQGLRKGFFGALGGIVSLIAGYAAAVYGLQPMAEWLKSATGLDGLLLYFSAGLIAFILASLITGIVFSALERAFSSNAGLSTMSRFGGLLVGTGVGCVIGLLVLYGFSIYQEFKHPNQFNNDTVLARKTRDLMSHATAKTMEYTYPAAKPLALAFVEDPIELSEHVSQVLNNEDIKQTLQDPQFQQLLERGDIPALLENPEFQQITDDQHLQSLMNHSETDERTDHEVLLARYMSNIWQKIQAKKNDDRVQAIINDPALQQKLINKDHMALLRDPQIIELMTLLFSEDVDADTRFIDADKQHPSVTD